MKSKVLTAVCISVLFITACGHEHQWQEATCTTPATCSECGQVEGEPSGHSWIEATCTEPKTCSVCGATEGSALGHDWSVATCTEPKTCSRCGATEGEALDHSWVEATCTEPKTCSVCGTTEGIPKGHEWQDATCIAPRVCIICNKTDGEPLGHDTPNLTCTHSDVCTRCGETIEAPGHDWKDATCTEPKTCKVCGEIEGYALGHSTNNGICEYCGKEFHELISGKGDDVINNIGLKEGNYKVHIVFAGKSYKNITINLIDGDNVSKELLDTHSTYDGTVLLSSKGNNPYTLEVLAQGSWSIQIENIEDSNLSASELSGKGDTITSEFDGPSGTWEITHDGKSSFKVSLHVGDNVTKILDTYGDYKGRVSIKIPEGEKAFFEIIADGNWTAKPIG